jgi:hypothetical protein
LFVVKILFNQRFIVWKLNNTNVDWKNTASIKLREGEMARRRRQIADFDILG